MKNKVSFDAHLAPLRIVHPEALFLLWVDCRSLGLSGSELQRLFYDEARVYIEEGSKYGPEGEGFVRLNIACPRKVLEEALNRIRRVINYFTGKTRRTQRVFFLSVLRVFAFKNLLLCQPLLAGFDVLVVMPVGVG